MARQMALASKQTKSGIRHMHHEQRNFGIRTLPQRRVRARISCPFGWLLSMRRVLVTAVDGPTIMSVLELDAARRTESTERVVF